MFSRSLLYSLGRGLRNTSLASEVIKNGTASQIVLLSTEIYNKKYQPMRVQKHNWLKVLDDIGKNVGQSTFDGLEWLFKGELVGLASLLRKLDGSGHPLLDSSKFIVRNWEDSVHVWGLMVLLVSKTAGYPCSVSVSALDENGILPSQRTLAEIVKTIRIAFLIQQCIYNLQPYVHGEKKGQCVETEKLIFGNMMALLCGDYFLAKASAQLATLKNPILFENISYSLRDFVESEFVGRRDGQNAALPLKLSKDTENKTNSSTIDAEEDWEKTTYLSSGSLMATGCSGALRLAGHTEKVQAQAHFLGKHFALARQATLDVEPFLEDVLPIGQKFSLVSAPVLFHLEDHPNLCSEIEKGEQSIDNVDYTSLHQEIVRGAGLEKTWTLKEKHIDNALKVLETFPPSESREALNNLLITL